MTGTFILLTVVLGTTLLRLYFQEMQLISDYHPQEDISYREFYDSLGISNKILSSIRAAQMKRACDPSSVRRELILEINDKVVEFAAQRNSISFEEPTEELSNTVLLIEGDDESVEEDLHEYVNSILKEKSFWDEPGTDEVVFFNPRTFEEEEENEEWELAWAPTQPDTQEVFA